MSASITRTAGALCVVAPSLSAPGAAQATTGCLMSPLRGSEESVHHPQALEGHYIVRMFRVPRGDSAVRDSARVELWLWASSSRDSSSRFHERATPGDTTTYPLFGVAYGDFWSVHAPVVGPNNVPPNPPHRADIDPLTASVIGRASPPAKTLIFLVGTLATRRPGIVFEDGGGIGLRLQARTANGFRGDWVNWGIIQGGEGYYCAERAGPAN